MDLLTRARQIMNPNTHAFNQIINSAFSALDPVSMYSAQNRKGYQAYINQALQGMNESNQPNSDLMGNGATPYAIGAMLGVSDLGPEAQAAEKSPAVAEDALAAATKFGRTLQSYAQENRNRKFIEGLRTQAAINRNLLPQQANFDLVPVQTAIGYANKLVRRDK